MNLLAHHVTARLSRPKRESDYALGALLPDLLALRPREGSKSGRRLRALHLSQITAESALIAGIRFHFESDVQFHRAAAFEQAMQNADRLLSSVDWVVPPIRLFFTSHIVAEICLDHALAFDSQHTDDFRVTAAAIDVERDSARLVALFPALVSVDDIRAGLTWLRDRPIERYREPFHCAEVVARIHGRAGVLNFTEVSDRARLAEVIDDLRTCNKDLVAPMISAAIGQADAPLNPGTNG